MKKTSFFTTASVLLVLSLAVFFLLRYSSKPTDYQQQGVLSASFSKKEDAVRMEIKTDVGQAGFETPLIDARTVSNNNKSGEYTFKSRADGMELRYKKIEKGFKEEIILAGPPKSNIFIVKMELDGLTPGVNANDLPIFYDAKGVYQFHFQKPFAIDSNGQKTQSLSYKVQRRPSEETDPKIKKYVVILEIDKNWLLASQRKYPVIIDPTIISDPQDAKPEVISKRTSSSKTFDLGNGKFAAVISLGPVNYYDSASNSFKPINETIVPSDDPLYNYMVKEGIHQVYFKTNPSTSQTIKFYYDSLKASPNLEKVNTQKTDYTTFQPMSVNFRNDLGQIQQVSTVQAVTGAPSAANTFSYPNVFGTGLSLNYTYVSTMLKEELIINDFSNLPKPEQYILDGKNATLDLDELIDWADNLNIYIDGKFWDKKTTVSTTDRVEFRDGETVLSFIPPAYAWDSSEERKEILLTQQFKKQGTKLYVIKKTPYSWLSDPERQYPVVIDPDLTFYPDPNPETSSVDGFTYHYANNSTWSQIRNGAGTDSYDSEVNIMLTYVEAGTNSGTWRSIYRGILLFDTSALPDNANISAATLSIYGDVKNNGLNPSPAPDVNIYSSAPDSNKALAAGDYDSLGTTPFCDTPITYANWLVAAPFWNDFVLNAAGIAAISLTGVSKFGVRNANYDVANIAPTWVAGNPDFRMRGKSSDSGNGYKPKLVVTYTVPIAPTNDSLTFTNPYTGGSNDAVIDNTTEWNFQAVVSDGDGYTDLNTVVLRLANSSDNTTPFDSLKFTWTEATDTFSETADTQNGATITSTGADSTCSGNTCTLNFKIKFNYFSTHSTNYNAELYTTDDSSATDTDSYTNFYQVVPLPPGTRFGGVKMTGLCVGSTSCVPPQYTAGPNSPGTMADDATVGSAMWINVDNAKISDDSDASVGPVFRWLMISHYLKATNFGFSIPAGATINGIVVEVEKAAAVSGVTDEHIKIVKADGTIGTTNKADTVTVWPASDAYISYGSSSDLWEETWTYSNINDVDFGVVVSAEAGSGSSSYAPTIDHIRITVYYTN